MGRPVQNQGFFVNPNYLFDAEPQSAFEKILINVFLEQDEAPANWVKNQQYNVGDKVTNGNKHYICETANSQATFTAVEKAPSAYSDASTYAVGDKVTEAGKYYICKTAISTPEAFDSAKWDNYTLTVFWKEFTLGGGAIEKGYIIKQVGYNKYFVSSVDGSRTGIVMLVKKANATSVGTAYITATDAEAKTHSVIKLMKDKVIAYVDEDNSEESAMYTFNYNIVNEADGSLTASFEPVSSNVQVVLETLS